MIDLKDIEKQAGMFGDTQLGILAEWIREAVRLMEGEAELHEMRYEDELAKELRAHIEKVTL